MSLIKKPKLCWIIPDSGSLRNNMKATWNLEAGIWMMGVYGSNATLIRVNNSNNTIKNFSGEILLPDFQGH